MNEQSNKEGKLEFKTATYEILKDPAQKVRQEYPELFSFLTERDAALEKALFEAATLISHPDDLPHIKIPSLPIEEVLTPKTEEECKSILDHPWWPAELKAKLYWYCRNGIYMKGTGISCFVIREPPSPE